MEPLLPIAVLFMMLLVFNAAFNLFCGLCACCIVWRDYIQGRRAQTTIQTGRYEVAEDFNGKKHLVTANTLEESKRFDKEFEEWLMMN